MTALVVNLRTPKSPSKLAQKISEWGPLNVWKYKINEKQAMEKKGRDENRKICNQKEFLKM